MRTFTAESLREIAFPLGGIGTGTVSLGGRGQLRDWEIFNRPGKGKDLPYSFFAIYAERDGEAGVARVLERRLLPPYNSGFGLPTSSVSGLPRLKEATFTGEYPFARIDFEDDSLPVQVSLEAYNPFIPMNEKDSGIPVALFHWILTNASIRAVRATVAFNLLNAVGYNGREHLGNRHHPLLGKNVNAWRWDDVCSGLFLYGMKYPQESPQYGTMAVVTPQAGTQDADKPWRYVTYKKRWERAGWWDDVQNFWDEFTHGHGLFPPDLEETARERGQILAPNATPDSQTDVGVLGLHVTLEPGQSVTLPFLLTWHFPNLTNTWNIEESVKGKRLGNWYATQWTDAWDVAQYVIRNRARLETETREYHQALYHSTLPECIIDAAGANASIVRTPTVLRTEDGRMNGFEGCTDNSGCCPMNCTHVWNYVQTVAYLFPSLERSVRLTDFQHNTRDDGNMAFRTLLPLIGEFWAHPPAADGQMGTVMKAYREWLQCGNRAFLESVWPGVQKAVAYAWREGSWDPNKDGVMEGEQHNTYDIDFYGPNTMCGLFYLGALRAAEEMAKVLGESAKAVEYRDVFEKGRQKYSDMLWNGEFFTQIPNIELWKERRPPMSRETHPDSMLNDTEPRYQYGTGCLADHLLGQWFARVVGLGDLLPPERVKSAIQAIYQHNFKPDLSAHESVQRVYALNDEAGLLLCTWPKGGRPKYPFPYSDEVWTGIEYQVAAHLIYEGFLDAGVSIVKGVRDRHDGAKRNPWDEFECGHHYARAMSSWSLLLALSGYHYDAGSQHLAFAPRIAGEVFRCFFTAGTAWGDFLHKTIDGADLTVLNMRWGTLTLSTLQLPQRLHPEIVVMVNGRNIDSQGAMNGLLTFAAPITLDAGDTLEVFA